MPPKFEMLPTSLVWIDNTFSKRSVTFSFLSSPKIDLKNTTVGVLLRSKEAWELVLRSLDIRRCSEETRTNQTSAASQREKIVYGIVLDIYSIVYKIQPDGLLILRLEFSMSGLFLVLNLCKNLIQLCPWLLHQKPEAYQGNNALFFRPADCKCSRQ